ncbi:diguanylate cyclase [Shewanella sp. NIFS-20-20]|uniref:GGDEF domain-containing protein n=1 Tax=Shewanella sp. NIFS-20-20 TaxID=2853806 RepID=UPI00210B54EE|nr:diguanylate cyclase [Shewanella sp. NIFS-20-20]
MSINEFDPSQSILENEHHTINLVRWHQQCELLQDYYKAQLVIILQHTQNGFEVITSAGDRPMPSGLLMRQSNPLLDKLMKAPGQGLQVQLSGELDGLPEEFEQHAFILSRPIRWPDSNDFGCLIVAADRDPLVENIAAAMLEPVQVLLQQDLALMCQNQRISTLSMRDRLTGMLNQYGFLMMAPRQLALGRRFGSHAGVIFFELCQVQAHQQTVGERDQQLLGRIIQDTIRSADIAARYSETEFVVLVFLDSERDLQHIIRRVDKSLKQQAMQLCLDANACFFSPDSSTKLAPMIHVTRQGLLSQQQQQNMDNSVQNQA